MKKPVISLRLSPDEIQELNRLASVHGAIARTGPTSGEPSWRVLISAIAEGEIILTRLHPVRILR